MLKKLISLKIAPRLLPGGILRPFLFVTSFYKMHLSTIPSRRTLKPKTPKKLRSSHTFSRLHLLLMKNAHADV
jgi:hypothetical protein